MKEALVDATGCDDANVEVQTDKLLLLLRARRVFQANHSLHFKRGSLFYNTKLVLRIGASSLAKITEHISFYSTINIGLKESGKLAGNCFKQTLYRGRLPDGLKCLKIASVTFEN